MSILLWIMIGAVIVFAGLLVYAVRKIARQHKMINDHVDEMFKIFDKIE